MGLDATGLAVAVASCVLFGSNFVVTKKYPTGVRPPCCSFHAGVLVLLMSLINNFMLVSLSCSCR